MLNCLFFPIMLAICEKSFAQRPLLIEDAVNLTGVSVLETRGREIADQRLIAPYNGSFSFLFRFCPNFESSKVLPAGTLFSQTYGVQKYVTNENSSAAIYVIFNVLNWVQMLSISYDPEDKNKWTAYWQTNVHGHFVELTSNKIALCGGLWNTKPVTATDWELRVSFKVFGPEKDFGDGMAIWYTEQRGQPGDIFCSRDYFKGLGVFLDTYKNGPYSQKRPFISAMVSNNDGHFKHHADGGDQMLGGNETGCQVDFRNKQLSHETLLLVRYVGDTLSVYVDFAGDGLWCDCLRVTDVHLPTGLYFGMTAMTGGAVDNHQIISVKAYEQHFDRPTATRQRSRDEASTCDKEKLRRTPAIWCNREELCGEAAFIDDPLTRDGKSKSSWKMMAIVLLACFALLQTLLLVFIYVQRRGMSIFTKYGKQNGAVRFSDCTES